MRYVSTLQKGDIEGGCLLPSNLFPTGISVSSLFSRPPMNCQQLTTALLYHQRKLYSILHPGPHPYFTKSRNSDVRSKSRHAPSYSTPIITHPCTHLLSKRLALTTQLCGCGGGGKISEELWTCFSCATLWGQPRLRSTASQKSSTRLAAATRI